MTPPAQSKRSIEEASAVVTAAAGLATTVIATAAQDATKALAIAASEAAAVVSHAAAKAVSEFPRLQDDIREIRVAQQSQTATITDVVTTILGVHTMAEEVKLKSIDETVVKIEAHMANQNTRLAKAEWHITRMNLVIFGIAGPVSLLIIGHYAPAFAHWLVPNIY